MRKKGRFKYYIVFFLCFSILTYGFFRVNITKAKSVRKESKFTVDFKANPLDLRIENGDYVFYVNEKVIDAVKEKCNEVYNDIYNSIFSK